jgi:hypothetical protein
MISNLHHFALTVPDVDPGQRSYEIFGLDPVRRADRLVLRCAGRDQDQVLPSEGAKRRIHHLSIGTTAEGLVPAPPPDDFVRSYEAC